MTPLDDEALRRHKIGRIQQHILFVSDYWTDLYEARIPGTRRPWKQTKTRAESRQQATEADELNREIVTLGLRQPKNNHPWQPPILKKGTSISRPPAHLDVVDALVTVLTVSHGLADAVSQLAGVDRPEAPTSAYDDPRPYLEHTREHLPAAAEADGGWIIDATLDPLDELSIVKARNVTSTCLRLVLHGQVLDADCPWCDARPLRVRFLKDVAYVVCESRRVCEPPESDCGNWVKGRPAWIQPEWDWLAKQIQHSEDVISA